MKIRLTVPRNAAAAEQKTATVMADPKATMAQKAAAAAAERDAGRGTWSAEHDLEAGA